MRAPFFLFFLGCVDQAWALGRPTKARTHAAVAYRPQDRPAPYDQYIPKRFAIRHFFPGKKTKPQPLPFKVCGKFSQPNEKLESFRLSFSIYSDLSHVFGGCNA